MPRFCAVGQCPQMATPRERRELGTRHLLPGLWRRSSVWLGEDVSELLDNDRLRR